MRSWRTWLRISTGPTFWIAAVHAAWTVTLVLWILYFVERRSRLPHEGWGVLVAGILLLVCMLAGVTVIVIHFARQVVHTRAVKEFISRVSHDLRSPLATVRLHLETMQLRELTRAQSQACLDTALHELQRLDAGIEDILTASRIERRRVTLTATPVDMGAFLDRYATAKEQEVRTLGGTLQRGPLPALTVRADEGLLRHLLDNLVGNAVVHCGSSVVVQVDLVAQGGCAVIGVKDNGPGLERRQWKKVFRMFYRAPGTVRHKRGTGLGLFIVRGIAEAHGGKAWVESGGPGHGCYFRVALPLLHEEASS